MKEICYDTAAELWDALSPTRVESLFSTKQDIGKLIYRGQRDSTWKLIPSVLRDDSPARTLWVGEIKSDDQVFIEVVTLSSFAKYADQAGVRIPNDSIEFRRRLRHPHHLRDPFRWPDPEYYELMALAQHHGVCTRLLDWTSSPYIALYFAASSSLKYYEERKDDSMLALWITQTNRSHGVDIIRAAWAISARNAAQQSWFTVHPSHRGSRREQLEIRGLEEFDGFRCCIPRRFADGFPDYF